MVRLSWVLVFMALVDNLLAEMPNVLFIAVDDMRVELGCYGNSPVLSPNIDRLAEQGVLFKQAYCQQAVCNPSRASLLTGRRPDSLKIWDLPTHFREVDPDIVTLPQHFKNNGYFTQNIGKIFHNWRQEIHGDPKSWSVPAVMHYATHGSDVAMVPTREVLKNHVDTVRCESFDVPDNAYFDGQIANMAVNALREMKDKPFFLAVGFWKPHLPFNPPKKYWDMYDRAKLSLPTNPEPPQDVPPLALHNGRELLGKGRKLTDDDVLTLRHGYYAGISYLDAQLGKVMAELDRLKLRDKTIIVFWSDHGFHLGEHSLWCKTSVFELDARVPLIISTPNMSKQRGKKTAALVELLDLYPTLVDLCGLPKVEKLEGTSLRPVLNDPAKSVKTAAYTQHPRPAYFKGKPDAMGCSVKTARYRYTEWRDFETGKIVARELYDHKKDPAETKNIVESTDDRSGLELASKLLERQFPRRGYSVDQ